MEVMHFVQVDISDTTLLQRFLDNLGEEGEASFRYFLNRGISAIENHVTTELLLDDDGTPVSYGHLDKENDVIWLGIANAANRKGKGLGVKMMEQLVKRAKELKLSSIQLAVDHINEPAISLYERFHFKVTETHERYRIMVLDLDKTAF